MNLIKKIRKNPRLLYFHNVKYACKQVDELDPLNKKIFLQLKDTENLHNLCINNND